MTLDARTTPAQAALPNPLHHPIPARRPYVVNLGVDALVVGLGSIAVYLAFRLHPDWGSSERVTSVAAALVWVVNYPHFAATNYRLYHRRSNIAQYPATAVMVPVVVTAAMAASFASPAVIAPAFVLLYQLWSPYHFSGQTVGVTLVYARRAGFPIDGPLRWALGAFVFATFARQIAVFAANTSAFTFYGVTAPSLGTPRWLTSVASVWLGVTAAAFVVLLVSRAVTLRRVVPLLVIIPPVAQYVWFAATPAGLFYYLVPCFHSAQYLLMAWAVQAAEPGARAPRRALPRWFGVNVALGVALFWVLPRLGSALGRSLAFSTAIVFAGVQVHHFFVDGVIWRLRHTGVERSLTGGDG